MKQKPDTVLQEYMASDFKDITMVFQEPRYNKPDILHGVPRHNLITSELEDIAIVKEQKPNGKLIILECYMPLSDGLVMVRGVYEESELIKMMRGLGYVYEPKLSEAAQKSRELGASRMLLSWNCEKEFYEITLNNVRVSMPHEN